MDFDADQSDSNVEESPQTPSSLGSCREAESTFQPRAFPDLLVPGPRQCHSWTPPAPADPALRWELLSHNTRGGAGSCRDSGSL